MKAPAVQKTPRGRRRTNVSTELRAFHTLCKALGVHTKYTDGLGRRVAVGPETLVRVCAALGAEVYRPSDAVDALRRHRQRVRQSSRPRTTVAWDGKLSAMTLPVGVRSAELNLADGARIPLRKTQRGWIVAHPLPWGYHRLTIERAGRSESATVISAPSRTWWREGSHRSWGVGVQLAATRSSRSRSVGDLRDLEMLCNWVHASGGDLVTMLPLLPTFNSNPPEPSPYSPVSRLFWSELVLDLGKAHEPSASPRALDVMVADAEVRKALSGMPAPSPSLIDAELTRYAAFRGAQRRLGRNWRSWPPAARNGTLAPADIDRNEERFHLVAQTIARQQLDGVRQRFDRVGLRLGLDLAVGVHPDGYDPWSRQGLFADGMSVGAPPDQGFPSGQDWGFSPVLPEASRAEGHRYVAQSIAHQAELAGVLRIDHIMAWSRLYWIPHGLGLDEGTYVNYPADELFAVLSLESHNHRCEIVGENLGTVPGEIADALTRHGIRGMYLAQFEAANGVLAGPSGGEVAMVGTHDTPTFAGWLAGADIDERVAHALLKASQAPRVRKERAMAVRALASHFGLEVDQRSKLLGALLDWLARSDTTLLIPWLEDFWLEERGVNLPGTRSSDRPNWQRPMRRLLDEIVKDPDVAAMVAVITRGRKAARNTRRGR
jgi:4-alpha-glucanotransferase